MSRDGCYYFNSLPYPVVGESTSSLIKTKKKVPFLESHLPIINNKRIVTWDLGPRTHIPTSLFHSLLSPSIAHYPKHITNICSGWSRGLLLTPSIGLPYLPWLAYASKCVSIPNNHIIIAPCHITQQQQQLQQRQQKNLSQEMMGRLTGGDSPLSMGNRHGSADNDNECL